MYEAAINTKVVQLGQLTGWQAVNLKQQINFMVAIDEKSEDRQSP